MSLPLFMKARHLAAVVLTPVTIGTAGATTDVTASAATLTSVMDQYSFEMISELADINAVNATRKNHTLIDDDLRVSLSILQVNNASDPSPLATLVGAFDYFKAAFTLGTGASARTITCYGHRETYNEGVQGKAQQIASLTLAGIDLGTASYTRA